MTATFLGMVHLAALPSARRGGDFEPVLEAALADARALAAGGVDGIFVENFNDAPFHRGTRDDPVAPDVPAALAVAARTIRLETGLPVGVNCLRNDAVAAIGAATVAGARWIRVNVLTHCYVTDQGRIDGEAARLAAYAKQIGARVQILADVLVKHAVPLAAAPLEVLVRDLIERAGADGVIVSGRRTGAAVDAEQLATVRGLAGDFPVWIGSGLTADNAARLLPLCDGAIVGSSLQVVGADGRRRVDVARVRQLRAAFDAPRAG